MSNVFAESFTALEDVTVFKQPEYSGWTVEIVPGFTINIPVNRVHDMPNEIQRANQEEMLGWKWTFDEK